jgi:hypothetical protein
MPSRVGLSLNASKARLIEFGRFAARNRRDRGLGKPETFDFLGFTHCCSTSRSGGFQILRMPVKRRVHATLLAIRDELKRRRHEPVRVVGQWVFQLPRGAGELDMSWRFFVWRYAVSGGKLSSDAASVTGFSGHATDALPPLYT